MRVLEALLIAVAISPSIARAEPDPSEPPAAEAPRDDTPPDGAAPDASPQIEVTVSGDRPDPGTQSLSHTDVRRLPGAFGDPYRAIEMLAGVTPVQSGLPYFFIRGAPPGDTGYFVDGVRVPYVFHAVGGPSVLHPALVDHVDLHSGGAPASFGRYIGGIVTAETTEPRTDWHAEGSVRAIDSSAIVEGGLPGGRGTVLAAGRVSYTKPIVSLISPELTLDYRDFQLRATYDVTSRDRVTLFAFGAYDLFYSTQGDVDTLLFGAEFYRCDLRYEHALPGGGTIRADVVPGFDRSRADNGRTVRAALVESRVSIEKPIGDAITLHGGFDLEHAENDVEPAKYVDLDDPILQRLDDLFPTHHDGAIGGWVDVAWQVDPRVAITPGLRVDAFASNGATAIAVDPRLAVTVDVTDRVRLVHSFGVAHQPPSLVLAVPGGSVAGLRGGLQASLQAAAGVEVALPWSIFASVTAFDSVFLNMTDTLSLTPYGDFLVDLKRTSGGAKGLEIYVRRSLANRIGGFVSYTLSRSTRSFDGVTIPAGLDRTHVLNAGISVDLGKGWNVGSRVTLYTGAPRLREIQEAIALGALGEIPRDDVYHRFDFRLEKRWKLSETGWISVVVEMLNATLTNEIIDGYGIAPLALPSIGVEGGI